jgi:hypothetical protein
MKNETLLDRLLEAYADHSYGEAEGTSTAFELEASFKQVQRLRARVLKRMMPPAKGRNDTKNVNQKSQNVLQKHTKPIQTRTAKGSRFE